jgi:hypothetical protein
MKPITNLQFIFYLVGTDQTSMKKLQIHTYSPRAPRLVLRNGSVNKSRCSGVTTKN